MRRGDEEQADAEADAKRRLESIAV